jgi:hypothetical protein
LWDYASATPSLHPTKHIYKLNNYVKELLSYPILPNGTNIGGGTLSIGYVLSVLISSLSERNINKLLLFCPSLLGEGLGRGHQGRSPGRGNTMEEGLMTVKKNYLYVVIHNLKL